MISAIFKSTGLFKSSNHLVILFKLIISSLIKGSNASETFSLDLI